MQEGAAAGRMLTSAPMDFGAILESLTILFDIISRGTRLKRLNLGIKFARGQGERLPCGSLKPIEGLGGQFAEIKLGWKE